MKSLYSHFILIFWLFFGFSSLNAQTVTLTLLHQPCNNDGIIVAQVTGISPPISYHWAYSTPVNSMSLTDTVYNYSGGPIDCYVIIGNQYVYSNVISAPPFSYSVTWTNPICPATLGTGTVTVSGGQAPYSVSWNNLFTNDTITSGLTTDSLTEGMYNMEISDANGCKYGSQGQYDSIWVSLISPLQITHTTIPANCTDGFITITSVTGGISPYSYEWSNGLNTSQISNLTMGNYSVTITDAQGCDGYMSDYVPQLITINDSIVTSPATCIQSNGSVISFGSGGTQPYSYIYSSGQTTQSATGLPTGFYQVQATDANGCISNSNYFEIYSSSPINVTYTTTSSLCTAPTGSANLSVTGGQAPYTVTWSTVPIQTGASINNMPPGVYAFYITDVMDVFEMEV